jgi:hypothetical protein
MKIEKLNNVMIKKVRYKWRINFSSYLRNGEYKVLDDFIRDTCVGRYHKSGSTIFFTHKNDSLIAYLRFA